jgi:hypothetical protein
MSLSLRARAENRSELHKYRTAMEARAPRKARLPRRTFAFVTFLT